MQALQLKSIQVLIFKALINSCNSHEEVASLNNVLRNYYEGKEEIENPEIFEE